MFSASDQAFQPCPPGPVKALDGRQRTRVDEQAPICPRCASTNTKFCYYNNYSLAQPRYFCKGCRRYWTMGGSLRSVPVGGGCRRSRRRSRSTSKAEYSSRRISGDDHVDSSSDSCSLSAGKSGNVEIDLAAVFAKYLKQDNQSVSEGEAPQSLRNNQIETQLVSRQREEGRSLEGFDHPRIVMDDQGRQQGSNLGFVDHDYMESFSDGMLQDVFWSSSSEDSSSLSTDVTGWKPMVHLIQELDSPPLASMSTVNPLISDFNWSCFDLEEYDSSSR